MENRTKPSPSPRPLPRGEGEPLGSSGRAECTRAFGRAGVGWLRWHRASVRGIEANIPRSLTKHSHVLPLPEGEGGVRGKGLAIRLRLSFQPLALVSIPKIASNPILAIVRGRPRDRIDTRALRIHPAGLLTVAAYSGALEKTLDQSQTDLACEIHDDRCSDRL